MFLNFTVVWEIPLSSGLSSPVPPHSLSQFFLGVSEYTHIHNPSLAQGMFCSCWMGRCGISTGGCWPQPSTMTSWSPMWKSQPHPSQWCWWVSFSLSLTAYSHRIHSQICAFNDSHHASHMIILSTNYYESRFLKYRWNKNDLGPRMGPHFAHCPRQRTS
jgi:hypothetical protein